MKLTPIKVRGKRTTMASKKRKMADLALDEAPEPPRKYLKRRAKKSLLERQIPLEIMERFFILSENTNFPLCSPLLGRLLSGRHTLVAAVIAAFGPTWKIGFGFKYIEDCWSFRGQASPTGNPVFQSAILECRWATVDLILEAQQQWGRSHFRPGQYMHEHMPGFVLPGSYPPSEEATSAWIETQPPFVNPVHYAPSKEILQAGDSDLLIPPPDFGPDIQRVSQNSPAYRRIAKNATTELPMLHYEDGDIMLSDVQALLEKDVQEIQESVEKGSNNKSWMIPTMMDFYLDVHPRIIIPNHLVTGPWDEEKIRRLIWLRRGGAVLHESQSWEIRQKGFRNAFHNAKASGATDSLVAILFLLGDFFWEYTFVGDSIRYKKKRCAWPKHAMLEMHNHLVTLDPKCTTNKLMDDLEATLKVAEN
ncbi:hypothetical protein F5X68DRAFT_266220 [Plectosphaerella plurivora]|uniref:Uncharacterized protein n=1 Tax=Plectosphaerella plurivora TaxID=936078 RepID=A0A9P9A4Z0_9PEZI|nr:hypothetical protein F5X68DRAFT_266220 [Plectosphaerella plurivora]